MGLAESVKGSRKVGLEIRCESFFWSGILLFILRFASSDRVILDLSLLGVHFGLIFEVKFMLSHVFSRCWMNLG